MAYHTSAFTSSLPVIPSHQHSNISSTSTSPRRRLRSNQSLSMVAAPLSTRNSESKLKDRSVAALRGLSDLGSVTVLHEIGTRLAVGSSLLGAGLEDTQLLLGGLMGVWTAALLVRRSNWDHKTLIRETAALPNNWDSAVLYNPNIHDDEIVSAIAWLYALDEMEGIAAVDLLKDLSNSKNESTRFILVQALTQFRVSSNICLAILNSLTKDTSDHVRQAAEDALAVYSFPPMQSPTPILQTANLGTEIEKIDDMDKQEARAVLDKLFSKPDVVIDADTNTTQNLPEQGMLDIVVRKMEGMGNLALSQPDLGQIHPMLASPPTSSPTNTQKEGEPVSRKRFDVPLFDGLRLSEVHGLCALALLPACYELLSMLDGTDHPLRFIGLGWLMTMGGLVAYPGSGNLWMRFRKTITNETD